MTQHAKLSASGSARWIACPGSVKAEEGFPNTTSVFAEEGIRAHSLAELVLVKGGSTFDCGDEFPHDMREHVQTYVDYVRLLKGELLVEHRVDFSNWVPEGFGTCDAIVIVDNHLHVVDYKHGKGIPVYAENNTQGILYALGAYADLNIINDFQTVTIHIVQPRLDNVSEWKISVAELLAWGERISQAAIATQAPDAPRTPSEKGCQWCRAKPTCPALYKKTEAALMSQFDDDGINPTNPDQLTHDQLASALASKKLIMAWLESVEDYVVTKLESGVPFTGYKLVAGRSLRAWSDDASAERILVELLGEEAFTHKLISVAVAEKALGKAKAVALEGLIVKPQGAPTLAPASDPRPAVNISADIFD